MADKDAVEDAVRREADRRDGVSCLLLTRWCWSVEHSLGNGQTKWSLVEQAVARSYLQDELQWPKRARSTAYLMR